MVTVKSAACGLAYYLARELNFDRKDAETIRYGMEIIFGALIKGMIIIGISWWLHITPYVLAAVITSGSFRLLAGGVHCHTYGRCLVLGSTVAVFIGSLAPVIGYRLNPNFLLSSVVLAALIGLGFVHKWAPADTPAKPVTREEKRKKFKKLSFLYVITWTVIMFVFILLGRQIPSIIPLAMASLGGFLFQTFSLCPAGYRLVGTVDTLLGKILP
ncbi:MAG: accessory gene regulator ArgB-like protein [Bacillota bacterium]